MKPSRPPEKSLVDLIVFKSKLRKAGLTPTAPVEQICGNFRRMVIYKVLRPNSYQVVDRFDTGTGLQISGEVEEYIEL